MSKERRPSFATYLLPSLTLPFRRQQSSSASTYSENPPSLSFSARSSISTTSGTSPPNLTFSNPYTFTPPPKGLIQEALQSPSAGDDNLQQRLYRAHPNTLRCVTCATDIAFASQIVSKGFTGRHGRAYLVGLPPAATNPTSKDPTNRMGLLINTKIGKNVNRELLTGLHVVADVSCIICNSVLGWKYVDAKEDSQKYKIGKFILEMKRIVQIVGWEDGEEGPSGAHGDPHDSAIREEEDDNNAVVFDEDDEDECEDLFAGVWNADAVARRRGAPVGRR